MGDIQFQISKPVLNLSDGRYYQRSRYVYDADGDGVLESHGERIHSSDSESTMLDPSSANIAPMIAQDLAEVAAGFLKA